MNLQIILVGPKRLNNSVINQLNPLQALFEKIQIARILWKSDNSRKSRNVFLEDEELNTNFKFNFDSTIEQPSNQSFLRIGIKEQFKWKKNINESNFFVTACQIYYTKILLDQSKLLFNPNYILKIRTDSIIFDLDYLIEKIKFILNEKNDVFYSPFNPHIHQKKQICDHMHFSKAETFYSIWPNLESPLDKLLFGLSKYNPERLIKLRVLIKNKKTNFLLERYSDYWNIDSNTRSYDPMLFQKASKNIPISKTKLLSFLKNHS